MLSGWGKRQYDWNFGIQVQQELLPRVSVNVGYFRRWFGNFFVTDNLATTGFGLRLRSASRRLRIRGCPVVADIPCRTCTTSRRRSGVTDNFQTYSRNYGRETAALERRRGQLQRPVRPTGPDVPGRNEHGTDDDEQLRAPREVLPEISLLNPYCRTELPFQTQFKGLGAYTIPVIDVQLSGTFQSLPGGLLAANYAAPNAAVVRVARPFRFPPTHSSRRSTW
jgi:hypothetical protein